MKQGGQDARYQMDAGAGIANLGAGHQGQTFDFARSRGGSAGALGNVLVDLAVFVRTRAESLY